MPYLAVPFLDFIFALPVLCFFTLTFIFKSLLYAFSAFILP